MLFLEFFAIFLHKGFLEIWLGQGKRYRHGRTAIPIRSPLRVRDRFGSKSWLKPDVVGTLSFAVETVVMGTFLSITDKVQNMQIR